MTLISKNVYINKLDEIVSKYNNTYHRTTTIMPVDVKQNIYTDFNKAINDKDPQFKVGDVRISNYKNIFAKCYIPNWTEEVFMIKKVKNTVPWTYVISHLNGVEIIEHFMKNNCKKQIKKSLELKR